MNLGTCVQFTMVKEEEIGEAEEVDGGGAGRQQGSIGARCGSQV